MPDSDLPIEEVLPDLRHQLAVSRRAILVAPPGAGKTTRVPLALRNEAWLDDRKIVVLEPRRLAARAAAHRLADMLHEPLGQTIGLRARLLTKTSPHSRVEVVTEGVFTRMVLDDPELAGVGMVIFDEFHERSLDADFGLALATDVQSALRDDLRILVMSATLDGARIAGQLGDCPIVTSQGRQFPVETKYLGRDPVEPLATQIVRAIRHALNETHQSVLVFLPGQREIHRVADALSEARTARTENSATKISIRPLYGALPASDQDAAIASPSPGTRHVILSTAIAETSITIDGISAVVDSGLERIPRYDVSARMTRLATVRVSRAGADQRRGRAGRLGPGICYRLWSEPENASLAPFTSPEILSSNLSGLLLDCAAWGALDPTSLTWLDPPPAAAINAARVDLQNLGALGPQGRITEFGNTVRRLPLAPALAAMICRSAMTGQAQPAAELAGLLVERGLGGTTTDLDARLDNFSNDRSHRARAMRAMTRRWAEIARKATRSMTAGTPTTENTPPSKATAGTILAHAYPDRIAKQRGNDGRYLMAGGRGANLADHDPLRNTPYLVIADLQGDARNARITAAAAITEAEITAINQDRITTDLDIYFDEESTTIRARHRRRLDALVLGDEPAPVPKDPMSAEVLATGIAKLGIDALPWTKSQLQLRARVGFLRATRPDSEDWPNLSDTALSETIVDWLSPFLAGKTALNQITADDLATALDTLVNWPTRQQLDAEAPTHFIAPTGNRFSIEYEGEHAPSVALRVQELFGLHTHPALASGARPLTLFLLSPAARPIQVTRDLPGFWSGSWAGVRADLRGRYPKHPWPEDPANAEPTSRAKRRR